MMYRRTLNIFIATLFLFVNACGGGGGSDSDNPVIIPPTANTGPVAQITVQSPTITAGQQTNLSAAQSKGSNASPLSYSWTLVRGPGGANLSTAEGRSTVLTTSRAGDHVVSLTVSDGQQSDTTQTTIHVGAPGDNQPPSASIFVGRSQVPTDTELVLDGSGSSDPENAPLFFEWTLVEIPPGSQSSLTPSDGESARLIPDVAGDYTISLQVSDGDLLSEPRTIMVTASPAGVNSPPQAIITPPVMEARVGTRTAIDGSASSDPDGDVLDFSWTLAKQPSGSAAVLTSRTTANTFLSPDLPGTYVLELIVNDGLASSETASATLVATDPDTSVTRPVADAGPDQTVAGGDLVQLNGTGSFDENTEDTLTYTWSFLNRPAGAPVALSDETSASPSFRPIVAGAYILQLIVSDGQANSNPDAVEIIVNASPVAAAGTDFSAVVDTLISLDGSLSGDPDNHPHPLTYSWRVANATGTGVEVTTPQQPIAGFRPMTPGTYTATLEVSDGFATAIDDVQITVNPAPEDRPVADAGPGGEVNLGSEVTLNGSGSSDPGGNALTFAWSFISVPAGSNLTNESLHQTAPTAALATLTPDVAGTYKIRLVVNNGTQDSAEATTTFYASAIPVADPGPERTVATGAAVILNGGNSFDPAGRTLSYAWELFPNPESGATLSSDSGKIVSFTPDISGAYEVGLTVTNGIQTSIQTTVTITAKSAFLRTFGGTGVDFGGPVREIENGGGFIISGESNSPGIAERGGYDMVLYRLDSAGRLLWHKTYGDSGNEESWNLISTADGFLLAGFSNSYGTLVGDTDSNGDAYLVETDSLGSEQEFKIFGGAGLDQAQVVRETFAGGLIFAGYTESPAWAPGVNDTAMYVVKLTDTGLIEWQRGYGGDQIEDAWGLAEKPDGEGFLLAGFSDSFNDPAQGDAYLVELDSSGNQLSSLSLGEPDLYDEFYDLLRLADSQTYIAAGFTESYGDHSGDFYLVKLTNSSEGTLQVDFERSFGGSAYDEAQAATVCENGFALAGITYSYGYGAHSSDILLVKTDADGNQQWQRTYGGPGAEQSWSLECTSDGGFLIGGNTASIGEGLQDVLVIKTDAQGNVPPHALSLPPSVQNEGSGVSIQTSDGFLEPNAQSLSYLALNMPSGLSLNAATGEISGILPEVAVDTVFPITIIATDPEGLSAAATLSLTIKNTIF